eukprot:1263276-Rhodomonas_salina.1
MPGTPESEVTTAGTTVSGRVATMEKAGGEEEGSATSDEAVDSYEGVSDEQLFPVRTRGRGEKERDSEEGKGTGWEWEGRTVGVGRAGGSPFQPEDDVEFAEDPEHAGRELEARDQIPVTG